MKNYELTYLITPDSSETETATLITKVTDSIIGLEGSIKKTSNPARIKLGYLIEKKAEAFLVSTDFSLLPEKIADLEKDLKVENNILRYVIVVKKEVKEKLTKRRTKPPVPQPLEQPIKQEEKSPEAKKVELQEIDDKIDEILK